MLEADLDPDPLRQFHGWFADASAAGEVAERVALATASPEGVPSLRMVLVKRADDRGFAFHTNLGSRKASELAGNPAAALLFYWGSLGRQVRVEGRTERVQAEEAATYFGTRSYESRLAAWASPQSRPLRDRAELDRLYREAQERFPDDVPLPPHWGGFRLVPQVYEFWQHQEHRLHDRVRYVREGDGWRRERLAP
jgi:pyridoxamine 5'-phosphate oxidase